jgi:hypothetical protein
MGFVGPDLVRVKGPQLVEGLNHPLSLQISVLQRLLAD